MNKKLKKILGISALVYVWFHLFMNLFVGVLAYMFIPDYTLTIKSWVIMFMFFSVGFKSLFFYYMGKTLIEESRRGEKMRKNSLEYLIKKYGVGNRRVQRRLKELGIDW